MPISWDNEAVGTNRTSLQDFSPPLGYTTAQAAGATWADNPLVRAYQWGGNLLDNTGEKLDANAIDSLIKGAGVTDYTLPAGQYTKETAQSLIERARQKQITADIDSRTPYSWGETPVRAFTRAATMMADPLNLAATVMPGLGQEWVASRIAGGASEFGARALQGAVQGGAGMGALEAVQYPLAQQLHDDYSSTDSLMNVLTGATLGGLSHGIFGRRPAVVQNASPEIDAAAKQTAAAQMLQEQPVNVDHLYQGAERLTPPEATVAGEGATPRAVPDRSATPDMFQPELDQARQAIAANRERSVLDGEGQPPRIEQPTVPRGEATTESDLRLQDAQAKATEATQQAEAARAELQRRLAPPEGTAPEPKPAPELAAADEQIAKSNAVAKAYEDVVNCQRLA